jgi:hypothetical protein
MQTSFDELGTTWRAHKSQGGVPTRNIYYHVLVMKAVLNKTYEKNTTTEL